MFLQLINISKDIEDMRYSEIIEARKNPEKNPVLYINDLVSAAKDTSSHERIAGTTNAFASFTAIDKLGINPKSVYDTPIGIYAYPIDYVVEKLSHDKPGTALPFAGGSPYINIFSVSGNVLNLNTISQSNADSIINKIFEICAKYTNDISLTSKILDAANSEAHVKSPGGILWYVSMKVASVLAPIWKTKPPIAWNKLFRIVSIDGVVDLGDGIIHRSEPTQAVFFSRTVIGQVSRYYNKFKSDSNQLKAIGLTDTKFMQPILQKIRNGESAEEIYASLEPNLWPKYIKYIRSPNIRKYILLQQPNLFKSIPGLSSDDTRILNIGTEMLKVNPGDDSDVVAAKKQLKSLCVNRDSSIINLIKTIKSGKSKKTIQTRYSDIRMFNQAISKLRQYLLKSM